jgi:hypothetical protein
MAMNPAAKDSNSFASSNLSGGSADSAILGIPQNPPMPTGPQPQGAPALTPLAQQNNQSFGPQYWNTISSAGGTAQPNYADQIAAHNAQMLQQMQAEVQAPQQDQQSYYAVGPNNELQVGNTVVPMGDNPTMAANLIRDQGNQGVTQANIRPGFRPVTPSDVNQYLSSINPSFMNSAAELGRRALGGALIGTMRGAGGAAQQVGLEGLGKEINDTADYAAKTTRFGQPADTLGHGALFNATGNFAESAGSFLPYMIGGEFAAPIRGLQLAVTAAGAVIPSLAMGHETQQKLLEAGASPEEASKAGWKTVLAAGVGNAALMGGGMALTGSGGGNAVSNAINTLQRAVGAKQLTVDQAVAEVTNPAFWSRFGKATAADAGLQAGAMGGQGAAIANIENNASPTALPDNDPWAKGLEGAASGLAFAGLLSPRGAYHQYGDSARRGQLGETLNIPVHQVDLLNAVKMDQAAKSIEPELGSMVGKPGAQQYTADTAARSTDAYSNNLIAVEKQAAVDAQKTAQGAMATAAGQDPRAEEYAKLWPKQTDEENAAEKAASKVVKDQAKAAKAASDQQTSLVMHKLGVTNAKARSVISDALANGVDIEQIPGVDNMLQTPEGRKQVAALVAQKKGTTDGATGPTGPGNEGAGGTGSGKPASSMGAGVPDAVVKTGGAKDSTGTPAGSVQHDLLSPSTSEPIGTVKRAPIPDFSLEHTTGEPNAAWKEAHPDAPEHAPEHAPVETNNLGFQMKGPKQELLFSAKDNPVPTKKGKRTVTPEASGDSMAYVAPEAKGTPESVWNSLKSVGHQKYEDLSPEHRNLVDVQHAKGELSQEHLEAAIAEGKARDEATKKEAADAAAAEKVAPKRAQKANAAHSAAEDAKPQEEVDKDAEEKTTIVPESEWVKAFGKIHGPRIFRRINGMSFPDIAKETSPGLKIVSEDAVRKSVSRGTEESIAKAIKDGTVEPLVGADMLRQLAKGHKGTVEVKTNAAVAKEGGDSSALTNDISGEQLADLQVNGSVHVTSADKMGAKPETEQKEGYGATLSKREEALLAPIREKQAELDAAVAAKDFKKAALIREEQKLLAAKWNEGKTEPTKTAGRVTAEDIEARIEELQNDLIDAESNGKLKEAEKIQSEINDLKDKLEAKDTHHDDAEFHMGSRGLIADETMDANERNKTSTRGGITEEALQPIIDKITKSLGGGRSMVEVHDTAPGKDSGNVGGRVGEDGKVHLYLDGISDGLEGQKTLFHELFHSGLRKMGIEYHRTLNQLYRVNERVRTMADDWMRSDEGQAAQKTYEAEYPNAPQNSRAKLVSHATDEALARIAEELKVGTGLGTADRNALVRGVAKWLANVSDSLGLTKLSQSIRSMTYTRLEKFVQEAIEHSVSAHEAAPVGDRQRIIADNIAKLPEKYQDSVRNATDAFSRWGQRSLQHVTFTRDLVKQGMAEGMHSLEKYEKLRELQAAMSGHFRKQSIDAIENVRTFNYGEHKALSDFLQHSTLSGDWGYGDKATGKSKGMYDALSPRAQKVARDVFAHGDEMLEAKKKAIIQLADDTYGPMIEEAKLAGKDNLVKEITADRSLMLKKYNSLMQINEGKPYTSARRQGDWVVVGKSEAFLKAENDAKSEDLAVAKKGQADKMEMMDKPEHYLVHEAENPAEARELIKNMRAMGFPESLENTYYHSKDKWKASLEGGQGVLAGIGRLKQQLDSLYATARTPEDKAKYETSRKLLTNMWLDGLGSASARKSELRRLGVSGSMDMIKAFRLQSTADSHFISGITYNAKMLDAMKSANKEVFKDNTSQEQLNRKQAIYDEFMRRHDLAMNAPPTPLFNKITQYTALWQIATSPAHYLGNLMQPWAMTLPYLQARHGYANSAKEFGKAYMEIGDILAKTGLLSSLKVSDMPADVRPAMARLLELGRLDIGMNTEYGSLELKEHGPISRAAQAATDRIRQASLKMESLNRLASAAAAYRMEFARTGDHEGSLHYAADVIAETHGDYSASNAPRMFNTGLGKMALQFRKFQLVQLTYIAKMIGNLKNADPEERAIAMRGLAYTLAHVGVLGGALAMPGFSTLSAASVNLTKILTGIEGEDWETKLDKSIGNRDLAQLILRGIPGMAGVDLTKKVGFGDMLGISPMADVDPGKAQSVKEGLGTVLSGPFGGLLERAATSVGHMQRGDYYKGLEGLMPQGVNNVMKGLRTSGALEGMGVGGGVTNTKGDKLMDVSAANAFTQALGFTPSKQAMQSAETSAMMKSTEDFKDRLDILKTRYSEAAKTGGNVSAEVKRLNDLRTEMINRGFKPVPLGDILKAPMDQLKRQIFTTAGGVQYQPKQTLRAVDQFTK